MKKTYYFSHDYNAQNDEKILKLMSSLGWEGYGLFWGIIERLYEADGFLTKDYETIAFGMRTEPGVIRAVVEDFGLFRLTDSQFCSEAVLRRLSFAQEKSEKARNSANIKWGNANALPTQCDSYAIKEIKVNEIKENESKDNILVGDKSPTPKEVASLFFSSLEEQERVLSERVAKGYDEGETRKLLGEFISYWTEPNKSGTKVRWEMERTFEVGRRLGTWFSRSKTFNNRSEPSRVIDLSNL